MTGVAALGVVAAVSALLLFVVFLGRTLRQEAVERDWHAGHATVLGCERWAQDRSDTPDGIYHLQARLVTADGRSTTAWAEGVYAAGNRWVGETRAAWHHPEQIERFRLSEPRGVLGGLLQALPALLVVLVVFAGFGYLATR